MVKASFTSCELCAREYINEQVNKIADDPLDSRKAQKINKIINDALRKTRSMCAIVECPSNGIEHFYCEKHLYQMLDAIHEEEEAAKDE